MRRPPNPSHFTSLQVGSPLLSRSMPQTLFSQIDEKVFGSSFTG